MLGSRREGAILLTGATGFLGTYLLGRLLDQGEERIAVLLRGDATERFAKTLQSLYEDAPETQGRVRVLRADIERPGLGLDEISRAELIEGVDRIVHCAASISFGLRLEAAREVNVGGLSRVIDLAHEIGPRLRRFVHVSTAYVCGERERSFSEHELGHPVRRFRNTYEQSKYEAESLLASTDLPTVIVRPSIVVGESTTGWTPSFNGIYWPMRAFERGMLDLIPARGDSVVDLVPVDQVADLVLRLVEQPGARGVYHAVAGDRALSVDEFLDLQSETIGRTRQRLVASVQEAMLPQGLGALVPYFDVRHRFADERAQAALGAAGAARPDPREYFESLINYARRSAWGKRPISRQAAMVARI